MAKILVTGGAGYIGSHTCIQLLSAGHEVVVLDNLSNSSVESLARVQALAAKKLDFVEGDILDQQILDQIFQHHSIDAVIHFAGLKAVGESQKEPLKYFENNKTFVDPEKEGEFYLAKIMGLDTDGFLQVLPETGVTKKILAGDVRLT